MSEFRKTPRSRGWWAATPRTGRRALLGGAVILVGLLVTSTAVWASPGSFAPAESAEDMLLAAQEENALLQQQLADTQDELDEATASATASPTTRPSAKPSATPTPAPAPVDTVDLPSSDESLTETRETPSERQVTPQAPRTTTPAPVAVTAPTKADLVNPQSRYFGMYTTQAPFNFATFDDVGSKLGVKQSMVGYFGGWDQTFRADAVTRSWARGMLPLLTWEARPINSPNGVNEEPDYSSPLILGDPAGGVPGIYDDYLHQYARDIVATGLPLVIRMNHEMNGVWYPWSDTNYDGSSINGNRPGDYVAVWQKVHDIFEQEGANQYVIWLWAPNIINKLLPPNNTPEFLAGYYPGDDYVDWVGVSAYLREPYRPDQTWTFDYSFGPTLDQIRAMTDKPIMLAEVGATENGGHKAAWITDLFDALARPENQDIVGISWFNLAVTTVSKGQLVTNDWRIESRSSSLDAFREGLTDPASNFSLRPY